MTLRVFSHGGGVQSTAGLVLSATGRIDYPVHLFANVGDDSENPATLDYVRNVSMPYAAAHGVDLFELQKTKRDGTVETLAGRMFRPGSKSIPIPIYFAGQTMPGIRTCTVHFKVFVLDRWMRDHGATADNPGDCGIGISVDEMGRAKTDRPDHPFKHKTYPLLDLRLSRTDCHKIITDAGLPTPPKSSCYFCPFHRVQTWAEMRRDDPDLFEKAALVEDQLNENRDRVGKDRVYLTRYTRPIRECIGPAQDTLFDPNDFEHDMTTCDEGVCFV